MIKYQDSIGLKELDQLIIKHIVRLGLEEKIKIYGVNTRFSSQLIPLYSGQIEYIRANHPNKSCIITERNAGQLYATPPRDEGWLNQGKAIKVSLDDLRICKSSLNHPELNNLTEFNSTITDDRIWGLVLKTMFTVTDRGQKISQFENQTNLIDYLVNNYNQIRGVSKTSIENRFAKANKSIADLIFNTPADE